MYRIHLGGSEAGRLADRTGWLADAAAALSGLSEEDPGLAREAGVEVSSLEAKILLGTGAVRRVLSACRTARAGHGAAEVDPEDLARLTRLEAVLSSAEARIERHMAELEGQGQSRSVEKLMGAFSLAGTIVSLAKQIF